MTIRELIEGIVNYRENHPIGTTLFAVSLLSFFIVTLVVIIVSSLFFKLPILDKIVSIKESEAIPLGFDITALLIVITIIIIFIVSRINRE